MPVDDYGRYRRTSNNRNSPSLYPHRWRNAYYRRESEKGHFVRGIHPSISPGNGEVELPDQRK